MTHGPITGRGRKLPRQRADQILLHADRFNRAADALASWSEGAKKSVEYFEGKQWSAEDLAKLQEQGRPALTINKIKPLVNLVLGYMANNRTDIRYLPGHDGTGTAEIATALSHVSKQISEITQLPYVDAEVYLDGILTGRGYYDCRLDFESNDFGDTSWSAVDPFSVYLDPDGESYDLNKSGYVFTSRRVSLDEIEFYYGKTAAGLVSPLVSGQRYSSVSSDLYDGMEEVTPWRRFGGERDDSYGYWQAAGNTFYDWVDRARKTVRLVDSQHYVRVMRWFFIDLETGDRKPVPDHWSPAKVQKVLAWAQEQGNPLIVQKRMDRRVRWTHMIGDIIVYDDWSPYQSFTITPYFPYFRRGMTKGMVEDLIDPQNEVNKRRSARLNHIGRSSNGGWMVAKGALNAQQMANLEQYGSTPGVIVEWDPKGGQLPIPTPILPAQDNTGQAVLEKESENDLKEISGVNDSALGQIDRVQSGRAIEARQRQTIVGLEDFMKNYRRSKELAGRKQLEVVQNFYTEQRVIRITGSGSKPETMVINQRTAAGVINDVTLGKYAVAIDEAPLSKTFLEAQFEELLRLKELQVPIPDDFVIDASSLGRKEELKQALAAAREAQAAAIQAGAEPNATAGQPMAGPGPGGSRVGKFGESLPAAEPGMPQAAE